MPIGQGPRAGAFSLLKICTSLIKLEIPEFTGHFACKNMALYMTSLIHVPTEMPQTSKSGRSETLQALWRNISYSLVRNNSIVTPRGQVPKFFK